MSPDPLQTALGPAGPLLPIGEVQRQGLPPPHPTPSPPFLGGGNGGQSGKMGGVGGGMGKRVGVRSDMWPLAFCPKRNERRRSLAMALATAADSRVIIT